MKKQNVITEFTRYVSLSVLSMIAMSLYILADTFFIANGVGSDGLTALNLVLPVFSFISAIGMMLGMGASTKFNILSSEQNIEKGCGIFTQSFIVAVCVGLLFTVTGIFFSNPIAELLGSDSEILPLSSKYLKIILLFAPFFIINNLLNCFVRNDKNPKLSTAAMITSSMSNILLDYIFVYPCGLGIFGAALATGFSPVISICLLSFHIIGRKNTFHFIKMKFKISEIMNFVFLGISSFINEISSGIVILLFNFAILNISTNLSVAAYGIIANTAIVCTYIFTGIGQGLQPVASKSYATKKLKDVKTLCTAGIFISFILGTACFLIVCIFKNQIVSLFNESGDPELQKTAVHGIVIYFTAMIIAGINIVLSSFFSSIERPAYAAVISILRSGAVIIPVILILPKFIGMNGVWLTVPISETITFIITVVLLIKYQKKTIKKAGIPIHREITK